MKNKASTSRLSHPHDKFFKRVMRDKRIAREFLAAHLPEDIRRVVDLNQLELEPGNYINDIGQESIADLLFRTKISGHMSYLYLVLEHQSRIDVLMPFRMLKYTCNIIDKHLKETGSKRLPLVLPLVIYHGKSRWSHSTHINDLVDAPKAMVDAYFLKPFVLIDLNTIEDAILKQHAWAGVLELTLKHIFSKNMQHHFPDIITLAKQVGPEGQTFVELILTYILDRSTINNKEAFFSLIHTELSEEIGEKIMTIAEQLRREGIQQGKKEGMQQGKEEGRQETVLQLRRSGLEIAEIAKLLNLPLDYIKSLTPESMH